jgi:hypothetical protein
MSDDGLYNTRHTVTGKVQRATADQIATLGKYLEVVPDDAKPFEPGMFKPGEVGEFANPEPAPATVEDAQDAYEALLAEGHAPNSRVVREAKAALDAATEQAEAEAKAAAEIDAQLKDAADPANSGDSQGEK